MFRGLGLFLSVWISSTSQVTADATKIVMARPAWELIQSEASEKCPEQYHQLDTLFSSHPELLDGEDGLWSPLDPDTDKWYITQGARAWMLVAPIPEPVTNWSAWVTASGGYTSRMIRLMITTQDVRQAELDTDLAALADELSMRVDVMRNYLALAECLRLGLHPSQLDLQLPGRPRAEESARQMKTAMEALIANLECRRWFEYGHLVAEAYDKTTDLRVFAALQQEALEQTLGLCQGDPDQ